MITGEIKGINNVGRMLRQTLPNEIIKELAKPVRAEAKDILAEAKASIPVASGQTQAALKIKYRNRGLDATIGVISNPRGFIARFLTFGVKPHTIMPRKGVALKFGRIFAKSVSHPGIKPHDFLLAKTQDRRARFQEKVRQSIIEVLRRFNNS